MGPWGVGLWWAMLLKGKFGDENVDWGPRERGRDWSKGRAEGIAGGTENGGRIEEPTEKE